MRYFSYFNDSLFSGDNASNKDIALEFDAFLSTLPPLDPLNVQAFDVLAFSPISPAHYFDTDSYTATPFFHILLPKSYVVSKGITPSVFIKGDKIDENTLVIVDTNIAGGGIEYSSIDSYKDNVFFLIESQNFQAANRFIRDPDFLLPHFYKPSPSLLL